MIALLIGYEAIARLLHPISIRFAEAIPIACLGLAVNIVSAWLLSRGGHHHHHAHGHDHAETGDEHRVELGGRTFILSIHEDGVPPRFRLSVDEGELDPGKTITTVRPDGSTQIFAFADAGAYLESIDEVPEPHAFTAYIGSPGDNAHTVFAEHDHGGHAHRDNNMRAAIIHVAADAAVSVLVIAGLVLARAFGWLWMDPVAGIAGACVIASWSYGLVRDTGAILLDMNPDRQLAANLRTTLERDGDRLADLHLWRVGPGHLAAIISVVTGRQRDERFYRERLACFKLLSHVTIEVKPETG
jgi:cation diffusion facilitator family transporter